MIIDEKPGTEKDEDTEKQRRRTEHGQGNAENALGAIIIQTGHFFGGDDRNCDGDTGTGYFQCEQINRESHLVNTNTFAPQDTGKDDPVDTADRLDDKTGKGQDQRT